MTENWSLVTLKRLELYPSDLAELGGFSEDEACNVLCGRAGISDQLALDLDVLDGNTSKVIWMIKQEIKFEDRREVFLFQSNDDLRKHFPTWPAEGRAAGGFANAYNAAVRFLVDSLDEYSGIKVSGVPFGPEHAGVEPVRRSWTAIWHQTTDDGLAELDAEMYEMDPELRAEYAGVDDPAELAPVPKPFDYDRVRGVDSTVAPERIAV